MLRNFWGGVDLNALFCNGAGLWSGDRRRVERQNPVRTADGLPALNELYPHRQPLRGRSIRQVADVCLELSGYGICSNGLSREPPRHRCLSGGSIEQALSHWLQVADQARHLGRCQRHSKLAYLRRFRPALIAQARMLDADISPDIDWDGTAYALDSTTIDLSLSLFPWAPFRSTKSAVKVHNPARSERPYSQLCPDLRRQILIQSEVLPHSGLRTDSPARQGDEGIVVLRRASLTPQPDSSGALNAAILLTVLVSRAKEFSRPIQTYMGISRDND